MCLWIISLLKTVTWRVFGLLAKEDYVTWCFIGITILLKTVSSDISLDNLPILDCSKMFHWITEMNDYLHLDWLLAKKIKDYYFYLFLYW